ncbi:MAG: hypothetical protein LBT00_03305 [Spirochaetaceae bacterium]|jgi:hypothetical protein|nr:hypothetical protein [Spirochaetaceae bacterium]
MKQKLPIEYHKVAESLFPESAWTQGKPPTPKAVDAFAGVLGIAKPYTRLKRSIAQEAAQRVAAQKIAAQKAKKNHPAKKNDDPYGGGIDLFLSRFQKNFDLMVAKTWVEKDDEERKERLQWRIPGFVKRIESGDYTGALIEFSDIIHELGYLLFGEQSKKDDFLDYTFRIDPPMGLFFWYGLHLSAFFEQEGAVARDILLLGMCYLTDF